MGGETIDVIDNLIQAVSILNNTDKYLESLDNKLSEYDSVISDYEHFIESMECCEVDLNKLFLSMKDTFNKRRIVKNNIVLRENYKNLVGRLNNSGNREIMIQSMKNVQSKIGKKYHNRILTNADIEELQKIEPPKKKRGRPKKEG